MNLLQMAEDMTRQGHTANASILLDASLSLETYALDFLDQHYTITESEPTRSILCLSAASIAKRVKNHEYTAMLAMRGLEGNPAPREKELLTQLLQEETGEIEE